MLPKLAVLWTLLTLCAATAAVAALRAQQSGPEVRFVAVPDIGLILFVVLSVTATFASTDRWQSLVGERGQYQGLLTTLLYVGLFLAARVAVTSVPRLAALCAMLAVGATIVASYAIAQAASIDPVWGRRIQSDRAFASIGQPNALAAYLVIAVPLSLALAHRSRGAWRWIAISAAVVQSVGVVVTESRGGYLALIVVWGVSAGATIRLAAKNSPLRRTLLFASLTIALVVGVAPARSAAVDTWDRLATIGQLTDDESIRMHLDVWSVGASMTLGDPFLGAGPETFPDRFPSESREVLSNERVAYFDAYRVESPHNLFIAISAGSGIFALLSFGLFAIGVWKVAARAAKTSEELSLILQGVLTAGVAFLVANLFMTTDLSSAAVMWILAGATLGATAARA